MDILHDALHIESGVTLWIPTKTWCAEFRAHSFTVQSRPSRDLWKCKGIEVIDDWWVAAPEPHEITGIEVKDHVRSPAIYRSSPSSRSVENPRFVSTKMAAPSWPNICFGIWAFTHNWRLQKVIVCRSILWRLMSAMDWMCSPDLCLAATRRSDDLCNAATRNAIVNCCIEVLA